jgi:hypothetical protein
MKNKDVMEWILDEGIDPLTTVMAEKGEMYLSDILTKHLTEQLRIGRSEQLKAFADWLQSDTANLNYDFRDLVDEYLKSL